ncbi:MAG TPA: DUF4240 domain-containing protein [Verrucomicrobiae bacterium]
MTPDQFWTLVERVHHASKGDMDRKCELLEAELRKFSLAEVRSFHAYFTECYDLAYHWPLWAAAYIIGHGCSDDSFMDFRSTLISMGRSTFEQALANPEYLADIDYDAEIAHYEGYLYVLDTVEEDLSGGEDLPRTQPQPEEPSGERWDEDKVADLFPKLAQKYNYNG